MRIGLFLKYDREVVKWSENREIPDLWGRVDRYDTCVLRVQCIYFSTEMSQARFMDSCVLTGFFKHFKGGNLLRHGRRTD